MGVITAAILTGLTIAAAGTGIASAFGAFDREPQAPTAVPTLEPTLEPVAPQVKALTQQTEETARKEAMQKRVSRTRTLLTGPQGVLGVAQTGKKVLLGA